VPDRLSEKESSREFHACDFIRDFLPIQFISDILKCCVLGASQVMALS